MLAPNEGEEGCETGRYRRPRATNHEDRAILRQSPEGGEAEGYQQANKNERHVPADVPDTLRRDEPQRGQGHGCGEKERECNGFDRICGKSEGSEQKNGGGQAGRYDGIFEASTG